MKLPGEGLFEDVAAQAVGLGAGESRVSHFTSEDVMGVAHNLKEKFWAFLRKLPGDVMQGIPDFINLAMKIDDFAEDAHRVAEEHVFEPPAEFMRNHTATLERFIAEANALFSQYAHPAFAENAKAWKDRLHREEMYRESGPGRLDALTIDVLTQVVKAADALMPSNHREEAAIILGDIERIRGIMARLDELTRILAEDNSVNSNVVELMEIVSEFGDSYGARDVKEILRLMDFHTQNFLILGKVLDESGADEVSDDDLYYLFEELFTDFQHLLEAFLEQHASRLRELWRVEAPTELS